MTDYCPLAALIKARHVRQCVCGILWKPSRVSHWCVAMAEAELTEARTVPVETGNKKEIMDTPLTPADTVELQRLWGGALAKKPEMPTGQEK